MGPITPPGLGVHVRVVRGQGHDDAIFAGTRFQELHVRNSRLVGVPIDRIANPLLAVLVLNLIAEGVVAVGDLVLARDFRHFGKVRLPRRGVTCVVVPQTAVRTGGHPQGVAASAGLRIDVGPRPDDDVHAQLFGKLVDGSDVAGAGREIHGVIIGRMVAPAGVEGERGEPGGFDLLQNVAPEAWDGNAPVVEFAGEDEDALAVDVETVVVPLYDGAQTVIVERPFRIAVVLGCAEEPYTREEQEQELWETRHGAVAN